MQRTQGNQANQTGKVLENAVASTFQAKGFDVAPYGEWIHNKREYRDDILLKNAPYSSIYGHSGKTEFLLISPKHGVEIRIECKWQQSQGSVDEKFPYLYLNCIECMPEKDIIILIDGGGYKEGALAWLKAAVANRLYQTGTGKNIMVMCLSEFMIWANKKF